VTRRPHLFDIMHHCCVLCDSDISVYPWRIFRGRCTVPICFACQRKHGTRGHDTITSVLEQKLLEIFASEPVFYHGEKIEEESCSTNRSERNPDE
jgi:hypothetical protein